ncbi:MAG: NADH:ubiquinone oxidoreductase [bacterium]|nr:NADH:ubiquinone oxidoreductase [bacterium]MDT8395053.1 NADH:ubiquinone oxidoreductase [bacterium]
MDQLTVGIFGLTGCAGDQLTLLNCEDELLAIAGKVRMKSFKMASTTEVGGEIEVAFVEGSVCQPRDLALLREVRGRAHNLVALGTCACFGGVAAMDQRLDPEILKEKVYGTEGDLFAIQRARPLSTYVDVDFMLPGCPVEKEQLLETISCLLKGSFPEIPTTPVCADCRIRENVCLVIEKEQVCCGALTRGGCKARCPSLDVPCLGCRGPVEDAYYRAEMEFLAARGVTREVVRKEMLLFSTPAGMGERLEKEFD